MSQNFKVVVTDQVFPSIDTEPPAAGRLPGDLRSLLVTPHMAYYSEESIAESQQKAATQIIKVLTGGQPDYPVRP